MKLLERHFEIALETPEGIKKLRELILTLAMQGKLVKQDPKDQPASALLKEIEAEKRQLIKEGKNKAIEQLLNISSSNVPYQVPHSWMWVRLGACMLKITDGTHHSPSNTEKGDFLYISAKNIKDDGVMLSNATYITKEIHEEIFSRCNPEYGDILYIKDGATTGILTINNLNKPFSMLSSVALLKPPKKIFNRYLYFSLKSPLFYSEIRAEMTGVAITRVTLQKLNNAIIPLPPLAEQKRIVAKIDQLMALCDKLEAERDGRNNKRLKIHTAAINKLLSVPDKSGFSTSWTFITKNFNELYSVPENVEELKKAILQLAMMGKLVPQDPNDQPASELLKEIETEKKRLVKKGKMKDREPSLPIKLEEMPYELPQSWIWSRLSELGEINPRNNADDKINAGFIPMPLIYAEYGKNHEFEERKWGEIKKGFTHFQDNDVVLAKITPCFENGKSCVIKGLPNQIGAGTTELHVFRNSFAKIFPKYVLAFLKSPLFFTNGIPKMTGSAGQKRVPREYFSLTPFPLPPLTEQKRIVAKIDQLMFLCKTLEQQLNDSTEKQTAILNAVLSKL